MGHLHSVDEVCLLVQGHIACPETGSRNDSLSQSLHIMLAHFVSIGHNTFSTYINVKVGGTPSVSENA